MVDEIYKYFIFIIVIIFIQGGIRSGFSVYMIKLEAGKDKEVFAEIARAI